MFACFYTYCFTSPCITAPTVTRGDASHTKTHYFEHADEKPAARLRAHAFARVLFYFFIYRALQTGRTVVVVLHVNMCARNRYRQPQPHQSSTTRLPPFHHTGVTLHFLRVLSCSSRALFIMNFPDLLSTPPPGATHHLYTPRHL